ncbi:MAG: histidine kinase [Rhodocyclales bacterium]|nr:histidine kinase [Rhodocyclales bacterium]
MDKRFREILWSLLAAAGMGTLALAMHWSQALGLALTGAAAVLPSVFAAARLKRHGLSGDADAFLQRLIDTIPEPIYVKDAQSRYVMVNEAFAREVQHPAATLIGRTYQDVTSRPEIAARLAAEDAEVIKYGKSIFKEIRSFATGPDGQQRYLHVYKRHSVDASGQPIIVGAHYDITDLRLAEQRLQLALEREVALRERVQNYMQRLIDVIPQPVYVKDAHSRFVMVNEAVCKNRKKPPSELIGRDPLELGADPDFARMIVEEDRAVLEGASVFKEEHAPDPFTGEERYRIVSKGRCLDAEGQPVLIGANFDITAWRQAEQNAEQASAAKSLFLASMSHEIRTPLSGVIGTLRLALHDQYLSQQTRDYLDTSLANAESLLGIINDILDFSKIEAGQLKIENIDFDLRARTRDSVQAFRSHAASRSLRFDLHVDTALPQYVRGDPTRIRQVLMNLVGNAVKFTEQGSVVVRVSDLGVVNDKYRVGFSVTDTGIGIPAEALPRLFQKFQQADVSTTRRYGGTGLGLAICRELVEAMGGTIEVCSEEGAGTTFRFDLLLPPGIAPAPELSAPLVPHTRRLNVLCAEDVAVNQLIVRTQLTHMGHDVDMVETGLAAIQALANKDYDIVLMDGRMPEMDGADATRAIRAGGLPGVPVRNPEITIVALTANASEEDRQLYLSAGMNDFVTKPVSERQLHQVLEATIRVLDARRATSDARQEAQREPTTQTSTVPFAGPAHEDLMERVMNVFVSAIPERITLLEAAWESRDLTTLAHLFHSISRSAAVVGMDEMHDFAAQLQEAATRADTSMLEREYPRLRGALSSIKECFAT